MFDSLCSLRAWSCVWLKRPRANADGKITERVRPWIVQTLHWLGLIFPRTVHACGEQCVEPWTMLGRGGCCRIPAGHQALGSFLYVRNLLFSNHWRGLCVLFAPLQLGGTEAEGGSVTCLRSQLLGGRTRIETQIPSSPKPSWRLSPRAVGLLL